MIKVFALFALLLVPISNGKQPLRQMEYGVLHIAKCAGSSIQQDLPRLGIDHQSVIAKEICFNCMIKLAKKIITSFRNPRDHIVSQYFFQRDHGSWCTIPGLHSETRCCDDFPRLKNDDTAELNQFLDFYLNASWEPGLLKSRYFGSCYTPFNMQARAITCGQMQSCPSYRPSLFKNINYESQSPSSLSSPSTMTNTNTTQGITPLPTFDVDLKCKTDEGCSSHLAVTSEETFPDLSLAIDNLRKDIFFSFVVELYTESLCLLNYKMFKTVKKGCFCQMKKGVSKLHYEVTHNKHHEKPPHVIYTTDLELKLDQLSKVDVELYRQALTGLVKEIKQMEQDIGSHVLCPPRISSLYVKTGYIPRLWERDLPAVGLFPPSTHPSKTTYSKQSTIWPPHHL